MSSKYSSTVVKALGILELFRDDSQELGISGISEMIGMPVSSVHRLIQSLEYEGLLVQNRETRRYRIGPAFLMYSKKCVSYTEYEKAVVPFADRLGALMGETVNVSVYSSGQIFHVHTYSPHHVLRPNFPLNTPFPVCSTSVGRVFLSRMSKDAVRWVYENADVKPDMSFEEFTDMLSHFRSQGYALDDEEFNAGLRCVGAPVLRSDGTVLFAMSISAPIARMDDEKYKEAAKQVVRFAALASEEIQSME